MKGRRSTLGWSLALVTAFAITGTSSVSAQQPRNQHAHPVPGAANNGNAEPGAMSMMLPGPAMMVSQRQDLGLSNTQVSRLDSLAAMQQQVMQRFMPQAMRAMADLIQASTGDIDVNAAREAHERLATAHGDMLAGNLEAMKSARAILTPQQRTRWDAYIAQQGGMMGMMGKMMGMMHHGPNGMQNCR